MRVNKFLVQCGLGSRRSVDQLIEDGEILINNHPGKLGDKLIAGDIIQYKKQNFIFENNKIHDLYYLYFNKPIGVICTFEKNEKNNLKQYFEKNTNKFLGDQNLLNQFLEGSFHYAGRLDKNSRGLLLLTNDGDLTYKLTHPSHESEKEYLIKTNKPVLDQEIKKLQSGIEIENLETKKSIKTKPCFIEKLGENRLRIVLQQGIKRQIRLMIEAVDNHVEDLQRIRISNMALKEYKNFKEISPTTKYSNMILLNELEEGFFSFSSKPQ